MLMSKDTSRQQVCPWGWLCAAFMIGFFVWCGFPARAVTLEKVISREDPGFDTASARMVAGRDGRVYFSHIGDPGYALSMLPDGSARLGFAMGHATELPAVNADGTYCLRQAHFAHTAVVKTREGITLGSFSDLNNDNYDAPLDIAVGASGDFYLLDGRTTNRIIRLSGKTGKAVGFFPLPKPQNNYFALQVSEAAQRFYLADWATPVKIVGFDGKLAGTFPWGNLHTIADDGSIWMLPIRGDILTHYDAEGKQLGTVKLDVSERKWSGDSLYFTYIGLLPGGEIAVKRNHPSELFARYDLATGAFKGAVNCQCEKLTITYPAFVWTAGQTAPFSIQSSDNALQWRVWATPFGDTDWRELKRKGDQLEVPASCTGLYQLRVAPTLNPQANSEYTMHAVVEMRVPDSKGTVSVWTPFNRVWWGRGEKIPVGVVLRTATSNAPVAARVTLSTTDAKPLWHADLTLTPKTDATCTLPAAFTAQLAPGRYELRVALPGFTCIAQPIRLGPGLAAQSPFRVTLHGDYNNLNSMADAWAFADVADDQLSQSQALGVNQYVNRTFAGRYPLTFVNNADGNGLLSDLEKRLADDPTGVSTHKVAFGFADAHALGALGAYGMRAWLLLVGMDTALPIGASFPWAKGIPPEAYAAEITHYTQPLKDFPAFAGWDWVANWWVADPNLRYATPEEKTNYQAALKEAEATGAWNPVLDTVGDRTIGWQADAQQNFKEAMVKTAPHLATANAGPYRRPEVYPPASFANVDEVDLHYQAEQITTPNWTAHAPDFYKRPGKPAWMHPELFNDTGTGEMILPMSWLALMRGADGIGVSGAIPPWGVQPTDARSGYAGLPSVYRALNTVARQYGPWLMTLENHDRVAIVVSHRQISTDAFGRGIGGVYFNRLWEAYQSCLYARQPATFLYTEDVKPDTLRRFKALLLVGQQYEPEPALADLLTQAKKQGVAIFADGTCRNSLVKAYTPLGVSFDHVEKLNGFNNDCAYWDFPAALLANAPLVATKLAAVAPPVAVVDQPEVLVSERRNGDARFVWVVNDTASPLTPGVLWRLNNAVAARQPVVARVKLPVAKGEVVYDVFSGNRVGADGIADLRFSQARLYAVLPRTISKLRLNMPRKLTSGQTFTWTADVPGITARLPLHLELHDAAGALLDERFTTTGSGTLRVPINAATPVRLSATELISGQTAGMKAETWVQRPDTVFGPRLRDIAVSADGATALLNAFDWGENLYTLDLANGKTRWRGNIGHYFAYAPVATRDGFAVQGYDLNSAEGYHLYRLDGAGQLVRRFALPGLPSRMIGWAFPMMNDHINNFTVAPGGEWIAGAGDLALAVWSADGKLLWSQDWSATSRTTPRLVALGNDALLVANGMTLTAYEARTGKSRWNVTLDPSGEILGLYASADARTVIARASTLSGRVFVVRDGKLTATLPTAADDAVLTLDGEQVAITSGSDLKWYTAEGSLRCVYHADATLRYPRLSPDEKRLAVGSELGTLYVFDIATGNMRKRDLGALPVAAWLPDGDLVVATWMGKVCRLAASGNARWQVQLADQHSGIQQPIDKSSTVPTTRLTTWSNAAPTPLALTPNLLATNKVTIKALAGKNAIELKHPAALLFDGQPNAPDSPWLSWADCGMIDSGWRGTFTMEFDASPTRLRVSAITFVEDAAHSESWLRDARFEYWDTTQENWVLAQYLTSDAAIHAHQLTHPVEASKFRLACSRGGDNGAGWPAGNLRFGEIVFHGDTLGAPQPVAAR